MYDLTNTIDKRFGNIREVRYNEPVCNVVIYDNHAICTYFFEKNLAFINLKSLIIIYNS
ncbi:hypothetical protein EZS27_028653 [termite gut metagenome]|uniref:Uncharacterized protein n=1 Tax=termite gut metagenome TaxID=433724 RepID=A0A5J4QLB7_9ZZZZ